MEIALGRDAGAYTLGVATDEEVLHGINPTKKKRLITAGADVVTGDFTEYNHILSWLGYEPQFNGRTQALLEDFFTCHSELTSLRAETELGVSLWVETFRNNHKILLCGNGGSAADCDHIAGELLKGFLLKRSIKSELKRILASLYGEEGERLGQSLQQGLPAIALTTHGAAISAFANDVDAEYVYAQQVLALGKPGDLLVGISTSGNARNVDAAMKTAKAIGMCTMGLAGKTGGKLSHISDICMIIPEKQTYRIQEYHLMLYHLLCAATESELFEQ